MGWRPDWTIDPWSRNYGHGPLSLPPLRRRRRLRWALARHLVQRVRAASLDVRSPPAAAGDHPTAGRQPGGSAPGTGLAPPPALRLPGTRGRGGLPGPGVEPIAAHRAPPGAGGGRPGRQYRRSLVLYVARRNARAPGR